MSDPTVTPSSTPSKTRVPRPKPVAAVTPAEQEILQKHGRAPVPAPSPSPAAPAARSPFADGYDLEGEAQAVAHLIDAEEPDPRDPLYARYEAYLDRLVELDRLKQAHTFRAQGNPEVPVNEGLKLRTVGALENNGEDTMALHTLEACRLYLGVSPAPGSDSRFGVPGARRAATVLRQLFLLSSFDNPVADWKLIETDKRLVQIQKTIATFEKKLIAALDERRQRGLTYSIVQSKQPQIFSLGYHSPYGYAVSEMCVNFDYCVRVIKSATRRAVISKSEEHIMLHTLKKEMRSMFENAIQAARVLQSEQLVGLCRSDYLPQAGEVSKKRVEAAKVLFGVVPQEVFMGTKSPRHSLRNVRLNAAEMELLRQASQDHTPAHDDAQAVAVAAAAVNQSLVE